ncbi:hypothetical protein EVAR_37029_1 [Eumeta japonica]|uniref:Uncharacterized protein n=1 Tax=Eumeta variegata TaxID=151549 RepID=A0A4C1WEU5_EUMVA|nr:hypothetical protein EVAR_37029_1 [Eumeta japonica]
MLMRREFPRAGGAVACRGAIQNFLNGTAPCERVQRVDVGPPIQDIITTSVTAMTGSPQSEERVGLKSAFPGHEAVVPLAVSLPTWRDISLPRRVARAAGLVAAACQLRTSVAFHLPIWRDRFFSELMFPTDKGPAMRSRLCHESYPSECAFFPVAAVACLMQIYIYSCKVASV